MITPKHCDCFICERESKRKSKWLIRKRGSFWCIASPCRPRLRIEISYTSFEAARAAFARGKP